jgi:hypothetical protein
LIAAQLYSRARSRIAFSPSALALERRGEECIGAMFVRPQAQALAARKRDPLIR